ncbi:hypothetical protein EI982_15615 [Haloplanus rallus]|uniref:Uncharacterized protein n=1 Tax=Haloplanus rallus TaxID=1816183 RepID=A0A6B9F6E6_9EURY|nr:MULTISPECIES: hypothetical protein [Haloplanus]QGX96105.1 hypothetical protein EI982_15615 [Haloplanus rallus]
MAGTPHHALGDPLLTGAVATAVATVVTGVACRSRRADARAAALRGGVAYGVGFLLLWAGVRLLFWRFAVDPRDSPLVAVLIVGGATLALAVQGGLPLFLHASRGLWTPVAWLFGASWVCAYTFLRVGGEAGAFFLLALWTLAVVPGALLGLAALCGLELGGRRVRRGGWPWS